MFGSLGNIRRRLVRLLDRTEWSARWLYKDENPESDTGVDRPGVLLLQIDGLAYNELLRAIDKRRLPFLQRLIQKDHFVLRPFYSGLPSTTPAVQAELFFGIRSAVPAFSYFDRDKNEEKVMFDSGAVDELAAELERRSDILLLRGGSSYSNIFAGGAEEAPFCIQSIRLKSIYRGMKLKKIVLFPIFHLVELVRIISLSLVEIGLAAVDFFRGIMNRKNPFKELKFIFSRIGACIVLREIVRLRSKIDIIRGLRIIHANFVGYDEHSHRRGPDSLFAHWTLKGIDSVVRDIVSSAIRSERRDYQVIIFSDHGQEHTLDFKTATGRSIRQAVTASLNLETLQKRGNAAGDEFNSHDTLRQRSKSFFSKDKKNEPHNLDEPTLNGDDICITAMGPLGHVYLPVRPTSEEMNIYSRRLVEYGKIPLVFHVERDRVMCTSTSGSAELSWQAEMIFGKNHPFLTEIIADMERVCRHRHAGDFIISGWRTEERPLTFALENGSHGGPGSQETRGFVIIPESLHRSEHSYYRPSHLRETALRVLGSETKYGQMPSKNQDDLPVSSRTGHIRVMTYNVHSCIGADGKLFPERIARVIKRQNCDFIALQEVDRFRRRTDMQDQAKLVADHLDMHHVFRPILSGGDGEYGLAVLSREPIDQAECFILPRLSTRKPSEQRGIMHVVAKSPAGRIHLFNTHLSLNRKERLMQIHHILQEAVMTEILEDERVVFCGDLNSGTSSPVYRLLSSRLCDVEDLRPGGASAPTFYSTWPMLRLDHIFHSARLKSIRAGVLDDWECRLASDHLPVVAELTA